jgi:hypothetical protein
MAKIFQLTSACVAELADETPYSLIDAFLGGNPLFRTLKAAKAFAKELATDGGFDPLIEWTEDKDGTLYGISGADDDSALRFAIIPCNLLG